ncbi:MAG: tRNA lysidine(34) synthetase TilS [Defluviitaleaceae bacterium]|nr:tRNA lysidine(34) synthetase TilS [Defluviitaleaceae bacterium]
MHITTTIQKHNMLSPHDHILAAVSGGADSIALLYGLLAWREAFFLTISVAHVNHNLRGEDAQKDADFVAKLCDDLGLPLYSHSADVKAVAKSRGLSIEEAARQVRYAFLCETASACGAQKIALGHNQNDNAETLLLRLCRGTGLAGLGGIPPVGQREGIALIRPLIETDRAAIEAFLAEKDIPYRTDVSNFDIAFSRNRIRHDVIPVLQQLNPQVVSALAKSAELLREDETLLDALTTQTVAKCDRLDEEAVRIHIPALLKSPGAMQKRIIRGELLHVGGLRDVSQSHISQIINLVADQSGSKEIHLPGGLCARREYDYLLLSSKKMEVSNGFCFDLLLDTPRFIPEMNGHVLASVKLPGTIPQGNCAEICTKYFNYDKIKGDLQLRTRQPGDRIAIAGVGSKKLQDELSDRKIPKSQRDSVPLLAAGGDVLWILGHDRTSSAYLSEAGCHILRVEVVYEGND